MAKQRLGLGYKLDGEKFRGRTAEVTICIILKGLLDRPRQLPHAWKLKLSKMTSTSVIAQGIECSHGRLPRPSHQDHSRNQCISHHAVITVSAPRPWPARFQELMPTWQAVTTTEGFRGPGALVFCSPASQFPPTMGIVPTFLTKIEKSVSDVRLQVAKAYWAYVLCIMPRHLGPYISRSFRSLQ